MIGRIHGTLIEIEGSEGIIMTPSGVGYRVYLTTRLLSLIPPSEVQIYTYHQVREDAQVLYGFETSQEYQFYTLLLSVDGVGPKTAYTIISQSKPQDIYDAVRAQDVASLTKIPGLGKKTALKIILELSTKFKTGFDIERARETQADEEAVLALIALGYPKADARKMLERIDPQLPLTDKVKAALKKTS